MENNGFYDVQVSQMLSGIHDTSEYLTSPQNTLY